MAGRRHFATGNRPDRRLRRPRGPVEHGHQGGPRRGPERSGSGAPREDLDPSGKRRRQRPLSHGVRRPDQARRRLRRDRPLLLQLLARAHGWARGQHERHQSAVSQARRRGRDRICLHARGIGLDGEPVRRHLGERRRLPGDGPGAGHDGEGCHGGRRPGPRRHGPGGLLLGA